MLPAQVLLWLSAQKTSAIAGTRKRTAGLDAALLKQIRNELIPANRTDAALRLLHGIQGLHPEEKEQLALISARNAALSSDLISNLIDGESAGREQAQVNKAILGFTGELLGGLAGGR